MAFQNSFLVCRESILLSAVRILSCIIIIMHLLHGEPKQILAGFTLFMAYAESAKFAGGDK